MDRRSAGDWDFLASLSDIPIESAVGNFSERRFRWKTGNAAFAGH